MYVYIYVYIYIHTCVCTQSCLTLYNSTDCIACQAFLSIGFPRQENLHSENSSVVSDSLRPHGLHSPRNSPDQNTGVCSHSLLQQIFPTQGLNSRLPQCRQILYQLSYQGSSYGKYKNYIYYIHMCIHTHTHTHI